MAMGAVLAGGRLAQRSATRAVRVATPLVRLAVDPPLVPPAWRPVRRLEAWGRDWQARRGALVRTSVDATSELAADAAELVLPMLDLTPVVNGVLDLLDLDSIVMQTLDGLDLAVVVDQALREVDLTGVVLEQVDLARVVVAALDDMDLTKVVLARVDLVAVVNAALDGLDLTAIVQQQVDLTGIAEQVVEDIDLPQIIQESTGSVASEAVQSARLSSVDADEAISRLADKMLFRAKRRGVQSGAALEGETPEEEKR
jgi:hypothetical protein